MSMVSFRIMSTKVAPQVLSGNSTEEGNRPAAHEFVRGKNGSARNHGVF